MFNLIQAEWYQLRIRRSPKILIIFTLVAGLLLAGLPHFIQLILNNPIDSENLTIQAEEGANISDYTIDSHIMIANGFIIGTVGIVLLILVFIGFNREYKNRTLMNPIVFGYSRSEIFLSKLAGNFSLLLSYLVAIFLSFTLFNMLINGGHFFDYFEQMVVDVLLPNLPIWFMYLALYTTLLFVFENESIFIIYILFEAVLSQIFMMIAQRVKWLENIQPYLYFNLGSNFESGTHQLAALGYGLIFIFIGIYLFKRKDIK